MARRKEEIDQAVGLRVMQARKAKGLTQWVLAQAAGVQTKQISMIETGKSGAGATTLRQISQALDVSLDWLRSGAGDPSDKADPWLKACAEAVESYLAGFGSDTPGWAAERLRDPAVWEALRGSTAPTWRLIDRLRDVIERAPQDGDQRSDDGDVVAPAAAPVAPVARK